jgi:PAS domain S-box-containing protein
MDDPRPISSPAREASAAHGEDLFAEMANGLPLIVWVHDSAGEQVMVNDTFCDFFGVTRAEMKGGRWQVLMHPDDAEAYAREFFSCVHVRRPFHGFVRVRRADGAWRWLESWARPRFSETGEFRGMVGTSADITDRKASEDALQAANRQIADQHAQLEAVYRALDDGLVVLGADGQVILINDAEARLCGCPTTDELGRDLASFAEIYELTDLDGAVLSLEQWPAARVLGGDRLEHLELRRRRRDTGREWILSFSGEPVRNALGTQTLAVLVGRDVTERFRNEQELRASAERLREADRRKNDYLAMLGHELRNPLAAIQSATEVVRSATGNEPRLDRAAGVLARQSEHMARLIDGLLEVSRIASGKIELIRASLDLAEICREVLEDRSALVSARGLTLETNLPEQPLWVLADRVRLAQVLDNLLANAVKFTPDGGHVVLRARALEGAPARVALAVEDTGIGIPEDELPRIFEPFRQVDGTTERRYGGAGLGLALVQRLTHLLGGSIAVRSAPGEGSAFTVTLPVRGPAAAPRPSPPPPSVERPGG